VSDVGDRPEDTSPAVPGGSPPPAPAEWSPPPAAASIPPQSSSWTPPPTAAGEPATGEPATAYGWSPPTGEPPTDAAGRAAQEPSPAAPPRPRRHSRNPVDRLTRGLPNGLRITIDWIVTIAGAVAIVLLVKAFVVNPYRIPSSSMEPTLHCSQPSVGCEVSSLGPIDLSDRVLANRFLYRLRDPRRGEIIVFKTPAAAQIKCGAGGTFVKRLIGLPGDTVELRLRKGDGYVYINGRPLQEPYIEKARRGDTPFGPVKVKPGNYFMMGDNRSQSCDSRLWGTVPRANLIGKVFATYWPPKRISLH
jgi:signal peptidase I